MKAGKRILIIDDDVSFAESNKDLLEAYDYEVFAAEHGEEGMSLARSLKPDLIILDVMMRTNTEGFDVAREIKEVPELGETAVLLVTGVSRAMKLSGSLEPDKVWLPVDRILEKPIDPAQLVSEVERVIRNRRRTG